MMRLTITVLTALGLAVILPGRILTAMLTCPCCDVELPEPSSRVGRTVCASCTAVIELGEHAGRPVARLSARAERVLDAVGLDCADCGASRRGGERFCGHCGRRMDAAELGQWAEAMRRHNMLELLERAQERVERSSAEPVASQALEDTAAHPSEPQPTAVATTWRAAAWLLVVSVFCLVVAPRAGLAATRQAEAARLRLDGMAEDRRLPTNDGGETTVRALLDRLDQLVLVDWIAYAVLAVWLLVPYFVARRRPRAGAVLALGSFFVIAAIHSWWVPPSVSRDMTVRLAILMVLGYVTLRAFRSPRSASPNYS